MEEHETSQETEQQLQRGVPMWYHGYGLSKEEVKKTRENGAYVFILDMTE